MSATLSDPAPLTTCESSSDPFLHDKYLANLGPETWAAVHPRPKPVDDPSIRVCPFTLSNYLHLIHLVIIIPKQKKFRYFATSMLPVGPDGPDEKPLSPRDSNPEVTPSSPPQPTPVEGPPRPPFSCVPVYIAILAILALIILIGGVNAVLQLKPELIYGNSTESIDYFNHTLVL